MAETSINKYCPACKWRTAGVGGLCPVCHGKLLAKRQDCETCKIITSGVFIKGQRVCPRCHRPIGAIF